MLIRILEIPEPSGNYHFGSGEPQTFVEVDWFRDDPLMGQEGPGMMETEEGRAQIADFVKGKRYYDPTKAYLVLHPGHSFTINYSAL